MPIFLFSDIEGSTKKWEEYKEKMSSALAVHDEIFKRKIKEYGGKIIKHTGDGFFAVFENGEPILCAIDIQKEIQSANWDEIGGLRVRIALHAGYAEKRENDYFGPAINKTARILATAWGGQILASQELINSCSLPPQVIAKDLGKHRLKDLSEPQLLYCLLSPDLKIQEFPPLRSLSAHIHNLPVQTTPFLGREKELLEISQLLQMPECRLITIIGPGGIGKTRLALQVSADAAEYFPDGIFLIPLAPLSSAHFLISAIADQIKFSLYSRQEPKIQLFGYLAEKQMLLIFDNFEHIIEGAGIISEILRNAPRVKIIVTSREMLNLQGEYLYQIKGLEYPEGEEIDIGKYSAIQLFLQNARRIKADFSPSPEEVECIIRICQIVNGIPLGIELASSWLRMLSLIEITKEIEKNLDFLTSKMQDIPERHKSIRAVFEYSWNLLSTEEKRLLARLSIFPRRFSRPDAEKIAGATLSLLSSLMDKSLLIRESSGYYEMVGILRQFAREKLVDELKEKEKIVKLFNEYYTEFVDKRKDELQMAQNKEIISEIKMEIDNIRTAWSSIIEQKNVELIDKVSSGIFYIYNTNGWLKDGADDFQKIVDILQTKVKNGDVKSTQLLGKIYGRQANFLFQMGFYEHARELLNKSLKIVQAYKNKEEIGLCHNTLGNIAFMLSQYEEAKKMYNVWLEIAKELNKEKDIAGAYNNLGVISYQLGEYDKAKELFEKSKFFAEKIGYDRGIAFANTNIALILHQTGYHQEAKRIFLEVLEFDYALGDKMNIANTLNNLGLTQKALNEFEDAKTSFEKSLQIRREIGDRMGITVSLLNLGNLAFMQKHYEDAIKLFNEYQKLTRELNDTYGEMESYLNIGNVHTALKDFETAKEEYIRALDLMERYKHWDAINLIFYECAKILAEIGDVIFALEILCFIRKNEIKEKRLSDLINELYAELTKNLSKSYSLKILKKAKTAKVDDLIKRIKTSLGNKINIKGVMKKRK